MKKQSLTLLEKLQDNNYALYFAIITCIALAPNSFYMFNSFSILPLDFFFREIQAAIVALIISGSILYYTAKKNLEYASKFAYFEFFVSCCYYFESLIMTTGHPVFNWHIFPAIAFAYMLPWSVKGYAASIDYGQVEKRAKAEPINPPVPIINIDEEFPAIDVNELRKILYKAQLKKEESIVENKYTLEEVEQIIKQREEAKAILAPAPIDTITTEDLIEKIEKDEIESIFEKGSISAIK